MAPAIAPETTASGVAPIAEPSLGVLRRNIFALVWPVTVESVLQLLVSLVNTAMVGRLGAALILAVSLSGRVGMIVWALFAAVGTGALVLMAQAVGAGDQREVREVARQALALAAPLIAVVSVLTFFCAPAALRLFGARPEVIEPGTVYLRLLVFSMPFQAVTVVVSALLRGTGDTRTPMLIALIINVVNAILNWLLIFGNLGAPALGYRGSACATISAQAVGAVLALRCITAPDGPFGLRLRERIRPNARMMRRILAIGLPTTAEQFFWHLGQVALINLVNSFGTVAGAAHQLGLQAEGLSSGPTAGFAIAATAFVGQSLGSRNPRLARRYVREMLIWISLLTALTAGLMLCFPRPILSALTNDRAVINLGALYLIPMALAQLPQQVCGVYSGALRGSGDTRTPMFVSALGIWLVRLPLAYLFSRFFRLGIVGVWWAMASDITVRWAVTWWRYRRVNWQRAA